MALARGAVSLVMCAWLVMISGCESVQQKRIVPVATGSSVSLPQVHEIDRRFPVAFEKSHTPTPPVVFTLIERADAAMRMERWDASQRALEQALRIAPKEAKVYLAYGDFYLHQNNYQQARQMFYRTISLAGENSHIGKLAQVQLQNLSGDRK